jgi:hypothetical protein
MASRSRMEWRVMRIHQKMELAEYLRLKASPYLDIGHSERSEGREVGERSRRTPIPATGQARVRGPSTSAVKNRTPPLRMTDGEEGQAAELCLQEHASQLKSQLRRSRTHRPAGTFTTTLPIPIFSKRSYTRTTTVCSPELAATAAPLPPAFVESASPFVAGIGTAKS